MDDFTYEEFKGQNYIFQKVYSKTEDRFMLITSANHRSRIKKFFNFLFTIFSKVYSIFEIIVDLTREQKWKCEKSTKDT